MTTTAERFEALTMPEPMTGCILWLGTISNTGYGQFRIDGRTVSAHRAAIYLAGRKIPAGLTVDHQCRQPRCVNPYHLEIVTQRQNTLRNESPPARHARKTACFRGHPFTDENTIRVPNGRECRRCREDRERHRPRRDRSAYLKAWKEARRTR